MRRIIFVLILSLLISNCGQYENENNVPKKRSKRELSNEQSDKVKKHQRKN